MPRLPLAIVASIVACASNARSPQPREESRYQREMRAESISLARSTDTTYVRRMRDLDRQSRLVPIDSLARMYAAIPGTPGALRAPLRQEMSCELLRLNVRYGRPATTRAFDRMRDSLVRRGIDAYRLEEDVLAASGTPARISRDRCGIAPSAAQHRDSMR
jgi:hypothetical protein